MRFTYAFVFLLFVTFFTPQTARADDVGHNVSITWSPLHLVVPAVELQAELRLPLDFSVAAIGGYGKPIGIDIWEVGAQGRYYLVGSFEHGMPIGVEALYIGASDTDDGISASANGLAVGPFIGYKLATDIGFTLDTAIGVQFITLSGRATDGSATATASESSVIGLLNLNVGWSF